MTNDIIKAISSAINDEFGKNYKIYVEDIQQGLQEPCFSVVLLTADNEQIVGGRYYRRANFDVHFFPKDQLNAKRECLDVAERLTVCLDTINFVDNIYHMIKMNYEIVDGVLHFFVTYNPIVKRIVEPLEKMKTLTIKGGIENG
ncbi:MAG: hypothetical protein J6R99_00830 [Alphaproteobacteria bacterium]|nr:hypothetical protein [Alphaproteobacteria bacterium]